MRWCAAAPPGVRTVTCRSRWPLPAVGRRSQTQNGVSVATVGVGRLKKAFFKYKKRAQSRRDTAPPTGFGTRCFRRKRRGSRPYFCHVPANFGGAQHTTAAFMCVHALGTRISWHMHTLEHYLIAHAGGASSLSAPATSLKRKLSCISRFSDQAATPSS